MAKRTFDLTNRSDANAPVNLDGNISKQSKTLIEHAYSRMRSDIISGSLAPNTKLRVAHLQKHYDVSASTLREAISRLVSEYLVSAEAQRGYRVSSITLSDLEDLTDLRVHIEINALRQSIRVGNQSWKDRLQGVYQQLSQYEQPIDKYNAHNWDLLNAQFHQTLCDGNNSPWTRRLLRLLSQQGERYRHIVINLPVNPRDIHTEHQAIYLAAMDGNELRAALAAEDHIRATTKQIIQHAKEGNLPIK
jgi:DNA-binding GntR family transcriptional regulator